MKIKPKIFVKNSLSVDMNIKQNRPGRHEQFWIYIRHPNVCNKQGTKSLAEENPVLKMSVH